MAAPWTEKYRPKRVRDFVDNGRALRQLDEWLRSWKRGRPRKKAAFLYGPPGVGKTSCVEVLAGEHGFDLISLDASNWRSKSNLERVAGSASVQRSLLGSGERLILLDELEGMSGSQDRGGMSAITSMTKKVKCPIVLIVNDVWNRRFSSLRSSCLVIKFQRIPVRSIIAHLRKICEREGVRAEEEALALIAERSRGDLRSAITDLQALSQNKPSLAYEDVSWLAGRDRKEAVFTVLNRVFNAKTCLEARKAVEAANINYEMLFEWIYENVPHQLSNTRDLSDALDALSRADIYFRRVKTHQAWKLLKYAFDQMTAGVATARRRPTSRWTSFKFPTRIKAMSVTMRKRRLRKEIAMRMSEKLHMGSDAIIREVLPYFKIIFKNDAEAAETMSQKLGLEEKMACYLKE